MIGNKITISPDNLQYLYDSIKYYIEDLHETEIWGNVVFEKGWTNQHATEYYYQLKNIANYLFDNNLEEDVIIGFFQNDLFHPISHDDDANYCGGNGQMISVDYKGDIYPCIRFMESSLGESVPPVILGNVYDGMLYTEEQEKMYKELSSTRRLNQSTPECIDCMIATGCAWCSGYNYQDSGVFNHRATYICVMHQARSLANVYFWNKYYRKHNLLKRFKMYLEEEKSLQIIPKEELELLKEIQYPIL